MGQRLTKFSSGSLLLWCQVCAGIIQASSVALGNNYLFLSHQIGGLGRGKRFLVYSCLSFQPNSPCVSMY